MCKSNPTPSKERLEELLTYCPSTGVFRWKVDRGGKARAGSLAGWISESGYRRISIDDRLYPAQRLAYKIAHGVDAAGVVDHIDGNPLNNSIDNLQDISQRENSSRERTAKSGMPVGVCLHRGKYQAQIRLDGESFHLGRYDISELASRVYQAALEAHRSGMTGQEIREALEVAKRSKAIKPMGGQINA